MVSAAGRDVARALDALRRGWPVTIESDDGSATVLSVERADAEGLAALDAVAPADLVLSPHRAATLKLSNRVEAAGSPAVRIARGSIADPRAALAIADPAGDLDHPLKGPFALAEPRPTAALAAGLWLATHQGLLPALWAVDGGVGEARIAAGDLALARSPDRLRRIVAARLPLDHGADTRITGFRHEVTGEEHVALTLGRSDGRPPLVRLHSECLTGDVFGSLKCDCGPQLHTALDRMRADGHGVLLYLRQEGRGIGLLNKLRAYQLQDHGFDTVDANTRLGFAIDERDYGVAAAMLNTLGINRLRLLTNNPAKVAALAAHGVTVVERVGLALPTTEHNEGYLATKRDRTGHQL